MAGTTWIEIVMAVVFLAVCAMAGALAQIQRVEEVCRSEARYGLPSGNATWIGAIIGGTAGMCAAALFVYYYLFGTASRSWIVWAGRGSYILILAAAAGHLATLVHGWLRLLDEEADLKAREGTARKAQQGTLYIRRRKAFHTLVDRGHVGPELRARDDEAVEELLAVVGDPVLVGQRALSRLPFYGYLGTVCGILLMAQELTGLDEATESFKVLRDMGEGLVLAFQTTLAALLAYLPLRKAFDGLTVRLGRLERSWLAWRDERMDDHEA